MPPCSSSWRPGSPFCRCHRASARTRTCPGSRRRPRRAVAGADTLKRCGPAGPQRFCVSVCGQTRGASSTSSSSSTTTTSTNGSATGAKARANRPTIAAPSSGASQNSHSWPIAAPPENSAAAVERAGLTPPLVTGPVTNGGVNPARSTAAALFSGGAAIGQLWLLWLAALLGAAIVGLLALAFAPVAEPFVDVTVVDEDDEDLDDEDDEMDEVERVLSQAASALRRPRREPGHVLVRADAQ